MPATLSPFRYIQVARYIAQWWVDTLPGLQARRKAAQAQAARIIYAPRAPRGVLRGKKDYATTAGAGAAAALQTPPPTVNFDPSDLEAELEYLQPQPDKHPDPRYPPENVDIYRLMNDERAFMPGKTAPPNEIVVLCHGE